MLAYANHLLEYLKKVFQDKAYLSYKKLEEDLSHLISNDRAQFSLNKNSYKWFNHLCLSLFQAQQKWGVNLKEQFRWVRLELNKDWQNFRVVRTEKRVGFLQQFLLIMMVWGVIKASEWIIHIQFDELFYGLILLWQLMGLLSFKLSLSLFERHYFKHFSKLLEAIYQIKIGLAASMPYSKVLMQSQIETYLKSAPKNFEGVIESLKAALNRHKSYGVSIDDDLEQLIAEIGFLKDKKSLLYKRMVESTKLAHLVFFHLLCYFYYLYQMTLKAFQT
jgi:hypothetical protein